MWKYRSCVGGLIDWLLLITLLFFNVMNPTKHELVLGGSRLSNNSIVKRLCFYLVIHYFLFLFWNLFENSGFSFHNQEKATGNRAALWIRSKIQARLFVLGTFIHRHAGKVLVAGLILLCVCCLGLRNIRFETRVEKLWIEGNGRHRIEKSTKKIKKTVDKENWIKNSG